jgi:cell division control protein 6
MTQQSLKDIFKNYIEKESGIFKQKDILSHNFIPETTVHRDSHIKQLADILAPALKGNHVSNCFLYGKTGTGKTLVAKYVTSELASTSFDSIKIMYINCKMKGVSDTEYRLLAELSRMLGVDVPPTGLPTDEVFKIFYNEVNKTNKNIIVVLDEIDSLVNKIGDEILYNLTRINQSLEQSKISIIGISNTPSFIDNLDPRVRSSLSEEEIVFPPYNSNQLLDILKQRAEKSFVDGVLQSGVIEKCAALAAQEHGDARKALDLLRIAGELAEREGSSVIEIRHVDMAEDKLDFDQTVEIVRNQPKQSLAVLAAIIKAHQSGQKDVQTGDIFSIYEEVCGNVGLKALTQRRVSDLIAELDMLGVINTRVISKGRYGRTREIRILLHKPVLEKINEILKANYLL